MNNKFDKLTAPVLVNTDLTSETTGRPLAGNYRWYVMTTLLAEIGLNRLYDLFRSWGPSVTGTTISLYLVSFSRCRVSGIGACYSFLDNIHCLKEPLYTYPIGSIQTPHYFNAFHCCRFGAFDLAELSVARIRKLIDKPITPVLPLSRLGLDSGPPPAMWARNFKMRKHLLPVYADFLYRLQHNALYLGYRLQHLPGAAILCHHGCGVLETAPHLFWYCPFATQVWAPWLNRFRPLFGSLLDWRSVLLFLVEPAPGAQLTYG